MSDPEEAAAARAQMVTWAAEIRRNLDDLEAKEAAAAEDMKRVLELNDSPAIKELDATSGYVSPVPAALAELERVRTQAMARIRKELEQKWLFLLDAIETIDKTGEIPMPPPELDE